MSKKKKISLDLIMKIFLYFLVFLLPWQIRYIFPGYFIGEYYEYASVSIYLFDVFLIFLLALWLWQEAEVAFRRLRKKQLIVGGLFILYFCLRGLFVLEMEIYFYWFVRLLLVICFGGMIISKKYVSRIGLAIVMVVAGAWQGIIAWLEMFWQYIPASKYLGMAEQIAGDPGVSVVGVDGMRLLRSYGSLPHPNILGGFLIVSWLAFLYLLFNIKKSGDGQAKPRYRERLWFLVVSGFFIMTGIFYTFSRASWLSWGLVTFFYLIVLFYKRSRIVDYRKVILVCLVVVFALLVWTNRSFVASRFGFLGNNQIERLESKSIDTRIDSYKQATDVFAENMFFGVGFRQYTFVLQEKVDNCGPWSIYSVHNFFALVFVEIGIFGLCLLVFMFFARKGAVLEAWQRNKIELFFVLLGLVPLLVLDHWWWTTASGLYLLVLAKAWILKE